MGWLAVVLGVLVVINTLATVVVLRSGGLSTAQRLWELALVWLVPLIGAIVCMELARIYAREVGWENSKHDPDRYGGDGTWPD